MFADGELQSTPAKEGREYAAGAFHQATEKLKQRKSRARGLVKMSH
jgi:hypothetical protein